MLEDLRNDKDSDSDEKLNSDEDLDSNEDPETLKSFWFYDDQQDKWWLLSCAMDINNERHLTDI